MCSKTQRNLVGNSTKSENDSGNVDDTDMHLQLSNESIIFDPN